jgi:hypothetical protein
MHIQNFKKYIAYLASVTTIVPQKTIEKEQAKNKHDKNCA